MAHPLTHAKSSARRFGGVAEDYLPIHDMMDSSKIAFPDNRHRALTHNTWFIFLVEKMFGPEIELTCPYCANGDEQYTKGGWIPCEKCEGMGKRGTAKTRYICERHILEDFGNKYIPTVSDYLEGMEFQDWMNNGIKGVPSSHRKLNYPVKQLD